MLYKTALRKAKEGYFNFEYDIRIGMNKINYQTPSGKWKSKYIDITK